MNTPGKTSVVLLLSAYLFGGGIGAFLSALGVIFAFIAVIWYFGDMDHARDRLEYLESQLVFTSDPAERDEMESEIAAKKLMLYGK